MSNVINQLRMESTAYGKEQVLKTLSPAWREVFRLAYNPDYTYGVNPHINRDHVGEPNEDMFDLLDDLRKRRLTGGDAHTIVREYMRKHGELIGMVCNKDLDCGVQAKTLNKVFGKSFIPVFKVQLAKAVEQHKWQFPMVGQLKYDGVRIVALVEGRHAPVTFRTRNGKQIYFKALEKELQRIAKVHGEFVFDGELIVNNGALKDRTNVSGLVTSSIATGRDLSDEGLTFAVFDGMPLSSFERQSCGMTYRARWEFITNLMKSGLELKSNMELAAITEFDNAEDVNKLYSVLLDTGYEGLILKRWDHIYTFKRSADWIKLKAEKDVTLKCIDFEYGAQGSRVQGLIGSLVCKGIVEGKEVFVKVGSGLTDFDRRLAPCNFVHNKVDVRYNSVVQDKVTGQYSLFLPRYLGVRNDL